MFLYNVDMQSRRDFRITSIIFIFSHNSLFLFLNIWVFCTHKPFLSTTWKFPQTCPAGTATWLIVVLDASCGSLLWSRTVRHATDSLHGRTIEHFGPAATHKLKCLHFTSVFFTETRSAALFLRVSPYRGVFLLCFTSSTCNYYDLRHVSF